MLTRKHTYRKQKQLSTLFEDHIHIAIATQKE